MNPFLIVFRAEAKREMLHIRNYPLEFLADQLLFLLGFFLLSGLFQIVGDGAYTAQARLISLIGFLTWRVADGCLLRITTTLANDARWGTLEQIWLSQASPYLVLIARSSILFFSFLFRILLLAFVIIPVFQLQPSFPPGVFIIFLLTEIGVIGVAFIIVGLHLVFKSVVSITMAFSTALLFVTGAFAPLTPGTFLFHLSRILPLGAGISLLQQLITGHLAFSALLKHPDLYWLIGTTIVYTLLGWITLEWGHQIARQNGSLSHY